MVTLTQADRTGIDNVLSNGGTHTLTIDASDIDMDAAKEKWENIAPGLTTGFPLPISSPTNATDATRLIMYGDVWSRELLKIANKGGDVIYRKLPSGQYEAKITR